MATSAALVDVELWDGGTELLTAMQSPAQIPVKKPVPAE